MKSKILCPTLRITRAAICMCISLAVGPNVANSQQRNSEKSPEYKIAYRTRTKGEPSLLQVHISIDAKHFNRHDMTALARRLNKHFRRELRVTVVICDRYEAARRPDVIHDLSIGAPPTALRGFYEIDRVAGRDGICFSTERGKPLDEIDIDLSKAR